MACAAAPSDFGPFVRLLPLFGASGIVSGVGQDEEPFPLVGRANIGGSNTTPLCIEPQRGNIPDDFSKSRSIVDRK